MSKRYILALDQGTTGSTCLVLDSQLKVVGRAYQEFPQHYPEPGWVQHEPEEIWSCTLDVLKGALAEARLEAKDVAALGITNQRETTVLWERATGKAVHPAIVWQCRRSVPIVERWVGEGAEEITERTGLVPDAYFSASKIRWLLENIPGLEARCAKNEILFGTIDTFLVWRLTGGEHHVTEPSNASRTMVFNLHELEWDRLLLDRFQIPESILPRVRRSVCEFGVVKKDLLGAEIPIMGMAGDQQAALFGQACFSPGELKNTYGTGCFLMMNSGIRPVPSKHKLLSTVAWRIDERTEYALEGSVFSAGSAVQWLRDGLGLIGKAAETEALASSVTSSDGVVFVPAFNGLGAPYWDAHARGALLGITRGTTKAHMVRAVLESVAFQTRDVVEAMVADSGYRLAGLRTDGGMVANNFLMQFQADLLGVNVERPVMAESTAMGAGCLAGLGAGVFANREEIRAARQVERTFTPGGKHEEGYQLWKRAVERAGKWA